MSSYADARKGKGRHHNVAGQDYKNRELPRGTWERTSWQTWRCSVCLLEQVEVFSTCPMCGARMK